MFCYREYQTLYLGDTVEEDQSEPFIQPEAKNVDTAEEDEPIANDVKETADNIDSASPDIVKEEDIVIDTDTAAQKEEETMQETTDETMQDTKQETVKDTSDNDDSAANPEPTDPDTTSDPPINIGEENVVNDDKLDNTDLKGQTDKEASDTENLESTDVNSDNMKNENDINNDEQTSNTDNLNADKTKVNEEEKHDETNISKERSDISASDEPSDNINNDDSAEQIDRSNEKTTDNSEEEVNNDKQENKMPSSDSEAKVNDEVNAPIDDPTPDAEVNDIPLDNTPITPSETNVHEENGSNDVPDTSNTKSDVDNGAQYVAPEDKDIDNNEENNEESKDIENDNSPLERKGIFYKYSIVIMILNTDMHYLIYFILI